MQMLADTNTDPVQLAAGSVLRLSQLLYVALLLPPLVNSAAPFGSDLRSQTLTY